MRYFLLFCGLLAACAPVKPASELPFVRGYRADADQCQLLGENHLTAEFLDDAADLVGCPTDYEGIGVFVTETGAQRLGTYKDYTLFTVQIR